MDVMSFLKKPVVQVGGFTVTVGLLVVAGIAGYFVFVRRR